MSAITPTLQSIDSAYSTLTGALADAQAEIAALKAAVPTKTLFGVDGQPLDITGYPRTQYCREYTPPGQGAKLVQAPVSVALPHLSEKDTPTPALERPLYDSLNRPIIDEWNHEPEGDMPADAYTTGVKALHDIRAAHPNGRYVKIAQTFTRYAQVHGKTMSDGKPASWRNLWVEGSDLIGFDCEIDTSIKGYPDPAQFFAVAVQASAELGVPFLIPELGWPQQTSDTDGSGLGAWYLACAAYLRHQNCAGVAAFNVAKGTTGNYLLTGAAKVAWQHVVASQ